MIRAYLSIKEKVSRGFTLTELMVAVAIVAVLAATSLPAYKTFIKNTQLISAELEIRSALLLFSADKGYSPATGMLSDLVSYGYLDAIPNDPWTVEGGSNLAQNAPNNATMLAELGIQILDTFTPTAWAVTTGTFEINDWYYSNDGQNLTVYAYSHPSSVKVISSAGLPPFASPPASPPPSSPPPDNKPSSDNDSKADKPSDSKKDDEADKESDSKKDNEPDKESDSKEDDESDKESDSKKDDESDKDSRSKSDQD